MRIAIHTKTIQKSGIGNYIHVLVTHLPQQGRNVEVMTFTDDFQMHKDSFLNMYMNRFKRIIYNVFFLPIWLHKNDIDIFHNPSNTKVPLWSACRVVSTIHDIIPHVYSTFYLNSWLARVYYETMIRVTIKRSDIIITISEFSKQELMRVYGVLPNKIRVIPQACSSACRVLPKKEIQAVEEKYKLFRPYIMTIGGSEYRKNVKTVLEAYNKRFAATYDIVVIGGAWKNVDLSEMYHEQRGVHFFQGISDEDLIGLYNGAAVFVFASLYEGFGLPLLEAMNCGTPVLAAKSSCLSEVAGNAAEYFEPLDIDALCCALENVLSNKVLQKDMVNRGFVRSKLYNWDKTVAMTYEVYQEALSIKHDAT